MTVVSVSRRGDGHLCTGRNRQDMYGAVGVCWWSDGLPAFSGCYKVALTSSIDILGTEASYGSKFVTLQVIS